MNKILLIDSLEGSDHRILQYLRDANYNVTVVHDNDKILYSICSYVDLIVLNSALSGMKCNEICANIRNISSAPIIYLSSAQTENIITAVFESGADDCLIAPFSSRELLTRIYILFKKHGALKNNLPMASDNHIIISGILEINTYSMDVFVSGQRANLTNTEYNILVLLASHQSILFTSEEIYERLWTASISIQCSKTVDMHISNLRKKIEYDPNGHKYIQRVWGKGYHFVPA